MNRDQQIHQFLKALEDVLIGIHPGDKPEAVKDREALRLADRLAQAPFNPNPAWEAKTRRRLTDKMNSNRQSGEKSGSAHGIQTKIFKAAGLIGGSILFIMVLNLALGGLKPMPILAKFTITSIGPLATLTPVLAYHQISPPPLPTYTNSSVYNTPLPQDNQKPTQEPTITVIQPTQTPPFITGQLFLVSPNSEGMILGPDGKVLKSWPANPEGPASLSPDGKKIVYLSKGYIYIREVNTGVITKSNTDVIDSRGTRIGWSPDGQSVAFDCYSTQSRIIELCKYDLESGQLIVLTDSRKYLPQGSTTTGASFGSWSSNGESIAYMLAVSPSREILQMINLQTRNIISVLDDQANSGISQMEDPAISPDRKSILFSAKEGKYKAIYQTNLDGDHIRRVTPDAYSFDVTNPIWNPNGASFVALAADQSVQNKVIHVPTLFTLTGLIIDQFDYRDGIISSWIASPK